MDFNRRLNTKEVRNILALDILCEIAAFIVAFFFRYVVFEQYYKNKDYDFDLYRMLFILVILSYSLIFQVIKGNSMKKSLESPFFLAVTVVKTHVAVLVTVLALLYFAKKVSKVSRSVMAVNLVLGISFCFFHRYIILKRHKNINTGMSVPGDCAVKEVPYTDLSVSGYAEEKIKEYIAAEREVRFNISLGGFNIGKEMVEGGRCDAASIRYSFLKERGKVLGLSYAVTNVAEAVFHVMLFRKELSGKYICFSNAHTAVMGKESENYRKVQEAAAIVFPDGSPVAAELRLRGHERAFQVAGPDFMECAFRLGLKSNISHYFYGATEETLKALKQRLEEKFPGIRIAGMISPPFREVTEEEDKEFINMINLAAPDFVWVGLGAPKQEKWMWEHRDNIKGVMLGVGAGFDFHAGTVKRAPVWVQEIGLEWLYRIVQDPKRLIKRYLVTNTRFLWYTKVRKL